MYFEPYDSSYATFGLQTNDFLSEHVIYAKYEKRRIENLNQNQTKLNQSKRKRLMKKQPPFKFY